MKNVSSDVNDLNHGSFLVIETNEVLYLKLNVLGTLVFNHLESLNSYFWSFHLQNLINWKLINFKFAVLNCKFLSLRAGLLCLSAVIASDLFQKFKLEKFIHIDFVFDVFHLFEVLLFTFLKREYISYLIKSRCLNFLNVSWGGLVKFIDILVKESLKKSNEIFVHVIYLIFRFDHDRFL